MSSIPTADRRRLANGRSSSRSICCGSQSGYYRRERAETSLQESDAGRTQGMPDSNPSENLPPKHDPFDAPDAEDEADTRERVLEGGRDAGDGDDEKVRRQLGLEEDGDFS